jgi:hypothetical protein
VQQVESAGIPIKHLVAVLSQHLYLAGILLQDGGANTMAVEQTPTI